MKKTKEELKKQYEINEGHYTEVMDRAYTICEMLDTLIGNHPLLNVEPELKDVYDKLMTSAYKFYQEAGSAEYANSDDFIQNQKEEENDHLRPIVKDMPDDYQIDN